MSCMSPSPRAVCLCITKCAVCLYATMPVCCVPVCHTVHVLCACMSPCSCAVWCVLVSSVVVWTSLQYMYMYIRVLYTCMCVDITMSLCCASVCHHVLCYLGVRRGEWHWSNERCRIWRLNLLSDEISIYSQRLCYIHLSWICQFDNGRPLVNP